MKKRIAALNLFSALGLVLPAWAQQPDAEGSLARARAIFERVDADDDGLVSALEAGRNRIPSRDFVAYDADRDRKLSGEEFTLFYRQLLLKAGKDVEDDLDAEAVRIEAARRTRKAEEAERAELARQRAEQDAARRAELAREAAQGAGGSPPEAVGTDPGTVKPVPGTPPPDPQVVKPAVDPTPPADGGLSDEERAARARADKLAQDAARAEQARADKLAQDAARAEQARADKAAADAARAEKARADKAAADAARAERARAEARGTGPVRRGQPPPKPAPLTPEERAAAYVKRLVGAGRLTEAQARDFYTVLTAAPRGADGNPKPKALREALDRAKDRIGNFVVAGSLTSEEGRQLAAALDARAKAALPPPDAGGPSGGRRGDADKAKPKTGRDGGSGAGTRRASDPKDAGTVRPGGRGPRDGRRQDG